MYGMFAKHYRVLTAEKIKYLSKRKEKMKDTRQVITDTDNQCNRYLLIGENKRCH